MIIVPSVLSSLIRDLDGNDARRLALAFAERALRVCADALSTAERDSSLAYISAARDLLDGIGTVSDLGNARQAYFSARNQHTRLSDDVTWVSAIAVAACCQRRMEDAGIVMKARYVPDLMAVAKAAQAVVGRCAAAREGEPEDGDGSAVARRARWLEAKSQLLYLIESLSFSGEAGPAD
jgi:hypothetical protein